jgi:glycosyltransferase involved in cell wall biosynthesis
LKGSKKKIAIINKDFWPLIGGVETVVRQHAEVLSTRFDVDVLVCGPKNLVEKKFEGNDYNLYRFKHEVVALKTPFSISMLLWMLRNKYDVIYFHHPYPYGSLLGLFFNGVQIIYYHADIVKQKKAMLIFYPILRATLCRAKIVLTSSPSLLEKSQILKKYVNKVTVVPFWLDNEMHQPKIEQSVTLNHEQEKYFLFLGRLAEYKGLNVLVQAIKQSSDEYKFIIAGQGEMSEEISNLTSLSNVTIINQHVTEVEKNTLIENAYCLLFPSITSNEAFGIIQLEAMRYGVPIINTDLDSGVPWVARHNQEALTIKANSARELTQAIKLIYEDFDLHQKLSLGCISRSRYFDKEKQSRRLIEVFDDVFRKKCVGVKS